MKKLSYTGDYEMMKLQRSIRTDIMDVIHKDIIKKDYGFETYSGIINMNMLTYYEVWAGKKRLW